MKTVKAEYKNEYDRAFNSIRNRVGITAADLGRTLKVRVLGPGTPLTRANGLQVLLYNTNLMNSSVLPEVVGMLQPDAFNEAAVDHDAAIAYLRQAQNMGTIPFSVPVTSRQSQQITQGATVEVTVVDVILTAEGREGEHALGLNFNRVVPAENATSVRGAFEALMGGEATTAPGAAAAGSEDPFAATGNTRSDAATAGTRRAGSRRAAANA